MVLVTSDVPSFVRSDARNECGHYVSGRPLRGREGDREGHVDTEEEDSGGEREELWASWPLHSTHVVYLSLLFFRARMVTEMLSD